MFRFTIDLWLGARLWTDRTLQWRHNERDSVSNHQPHDCLLNRLFRRSSRKRSKLRVTGLCVGNSPGTGEFPAQMASNAEKVSIWWRHHETSCMSWKNMWHYQHIINGVHFCTLPFDGVLYFILEVEYVISMMWYQIAPCFLNNWGRVTHICVNKVSIVDSDNGLVPGGVNKCWNIVDWTLRNRIHWTFNQNSYIFIQENPFKNVVWKMAAILSRPRCVKRNKIVRVRVADGSNDKSVLVQVKAWRQTGAKLLAAPMVTLHG